MNGMITGTKVTGNGNYVGKYERPYISSLSLKFTALFKAKNNIFLQSL